MPLSNSCPPQNRAENWGNEIKRIVVTGALDRARAVPVERLLSWMVRHGCKRSTWKGRDRVEDWDFPDGCCYGVPAAGTVFADYADRVCDLVFALACSRDLSFWDALADLEAYANV